MRNFKRIENNIDNYKIKTIDSSKHLLISSVVLENENPFDILVKVGEDVKINQPILINKEGQKILSSISGKVKEIKLIEENMSTLTYHILLENDFKDKEIKFNIESINNKNDLINSIKSYGIVNKNFLIYKELENIQKTLYVDCFDEYFIYNNFLILNNFSKEIKFALKKLKQILKFNSIHFFTSKNNLNLLKKLKNKDSKIFVKKYKYNAINLFDIFKIYLIFKGETFNYDILSLTGRALKENRVIFVKNGTTLQDIIKNMGGFKQEIEEIENFKYTAMLAYNDEIMIKNKIKNCKNNIDKQKLKSILNEKKKEAQKNIFNKLEEYHQKYLNCLSACFITFKGKKVLTKNLNLPTKNCFFGVHFLNNKQFH